MTDPERAELDAIRAAVEKARKTLHDMSQPLTIIVARAHLLLDGMGSDDPNYRGLTIVSEEAARLIKPVEEVKELLPLRRR